MPLPALEKLSLQGAPVCAGSDDDDDDDDFDDDEFEDVIPAPRMRQPQEELLDSSNRGGGLTDYDRLSEREREMVEMADELKRKREEAEDLRPWDARRARAGEAGPSVLPPAAAPEQPAGSGMPGRWRAKRYGGTYDLGTRLKLGELAAKYPDNIKSFPAGSKGVTWEFNRQMAGPVVVISTKGTLTFSNFPSEATLMYALSEILDKVMEFKQ